jgi:hypothetical protein
VAELYHRIGPDESASILEILNGPQRDTETWCVYREWSCQLDTVALVLVKRNIQSAVLPDSRSRRVLRQ